MVHLYRTMCLRALLSGLLTLGLVNAANTGRVDRGNRPSLPTIWPPPQQISSSGSNIALNGAVTIVTGNATDSAIIDTVKAAVVSAGGKPILSSKPTTHGTHIFIGTEAVDGTVTAIAKALTGKSANGLIADGYVLASGN